MAMVDRGTEIAQREVRVWLGGNLTKLNVGLYKHFAAEIKAGGGVLTVPSSNWYSQNFRLSLSRGTIEDSESTLSNLKTANCLIGDFTNPTRSAIWELGVANGLNLPALALYSGDYPFKGIDVSNTITQDYIPAQSGSKFDPKIAEAIQRIIQNARDNRFIRSTSATRAGQEPDLRRFIVNGDLVIDRTTMRVAFMGAEIEVEMSGFRILEALATRPGVLFSKQQINKLGWPTPVNLKSGLRAKISRLRTKLKENDRSHHYLVGNTSGYFMRDLSEQSPKLREGSSSFETFIKKYHQARNNLEKELLVVSGDLMISPARFRAFLKGNKLDLSAYEMDVLILLAQHKGQKLDGAEITRTVWPEEDASKARIYPVVRSIRSVLQRYDNVPYINTVVGHSSYLLKDYGESPKLRYAANKMLATS